MGQKVNPTGYRTGIMTGWKSRLDDEQIASLVDFIRSRFMGVAEAAVAGGIPIIKALREGLAGNRIEQLDIGGTEPPHVGQRIGNDHRRRRDGGRGQCTAAAERGAATRGGAQRQSLCPDVGGAHRRAPGAGRR